MGGFHAMVAPRGVPLRTAQYQRSTPYSQIRVCESSEETNMDVSPPISPRAAGTEGRDWVEGRRAAPISQAIHSVTPSSVSIPMRDGVVLRGTLHVPAGLGPQPSILIANGYG